MAIEMDRWLASGQYAILDRRRLRPRENPAMKGNALCMQRGQAEAYILDDEIDKSQVLKKFLPGKNPDRAFLESVAAALPDHPGLIAGSQRVVIDGGMLVRQVGCYFDASLGHWMDGTVLMPRVDGDAWSVVAGDLRSGELSLDRDQRIEFVRNLTQLIGLLESTNIAHRDLSCGNVFVDVQSGSVSLIDFDGVYIQGAPVLTTTVIGAEGYIAPFVFGNQTPDVHATLCPAADRFALAVLIAELLTVRRDSISSGDGGLFQQKDLINRTGPSIDGVRTALRSEYPEVLDLFDTALNATCFDDCPSPADWLGLSELRSRTIPRLADLESFDMGDLLDGIQNHANVECSNSIPRLVDLPFVQFELQLTQWQFPPELPELGDI